MVEKDKVQKNAEQEDTGSTGGTGGTKEPSQSTAEFYSRENAPTLEDFTSGSEERDRRQDLEDSDSVFKQADASDALDAHGGGDSSGLKGSSATEVPESSDVGSSLLNPSDPQAGRLGDRADDLGLRPDHTSANVFDDAADAGGGSGGLAGMGNEGLMGAEKTGGGVVDNNRFVWNSETGEVEEAPKMTREEADAAAQARNDRDIVDQLTDSAKGVRDTLTTPSGIGDKQAGGQPSGGEQAGGGTGGGTGSGTDGEIVDPSINYYENEDGSTTTVIKNEDGSTTVLKGSNITTLHPDGSVTERNNTTGETTTTNPNDNMGLFGIPADEYETDLPPGFIDGEALLPPELRTESILQNMTGAGQKGGEEVNPAREGGVGQSGGTATDDAFRQTKEEMIGQPDPDAAQHGGKSLGNPFGPGQEEINPGEDGSLPPGETRSEDLPGGTTSSEDTSLGLEGGHDGEFDFSGAAEEIEDAQNPPDLPPGYEDDTTDELDFSGAAEQIQDAQDPPDLPPSFLDTTDEFDRTQWAEQIQDALNPPVLPPEPLDPTDDAGF